MAPHKDIAAPARPAPETWQMGAEAFERRMPHHDGIKALWETKWRFPCQKSVYPFHDGEYSDFEGIFKDLIECNVNDATSSDYTEAFEGVADELEREGDRVHLSGAFEEASKLFLRAACVLRISRFPYYTAYPVPTNPAKCRAWEHQKQVYMKAAKYWTVPVSEEEISHTYAEGADRGKILAYTRVPRRPAGPYPTVLLFTGLDGYRTDNTGRIDEFLKRGWASIVLEIPGTADCPADPADPESGDRLWSSVFTWMQADRRFDMRRVMCWGLSSGGYYAVRAAHTHRERFAGVVAQGAGTHHFFDAKWLKRADGHEYPFPLLPALAKKHGCQTVEEYLEVAQKKFSLVETGVVNLPSARLLLVNGTQDGLMPIEDSTLLFEYGSPKEARFFPDALHMGYPDANSSVYPWMEEVMASVKDKSAISDSEVRSHEIPKIQVYPLE
ncbi:Alpha/Beta hydrolase protein [Xylaria venustula]|nr:Alpha/Beta hydrolase protein [Xylaria venustula]